MTRVFQLSADDDFAGSLRRLPGQDAYIHESGVVIGADFFYRLPAECYPELFNYLEEYGKSHKKSGLAQRYHDALAFLDQFTEWIAKGEGRSSNIPQAIRQRYAESLAAIAEWDSEKKPSLMTIRYPDGKWSFAVNE